MDYEERFRDFIVGWLAEQSKEPKTDRQELKSLYQEVVEADNDGAALTRVETALGAETSQRLWQSSEQWHDPGVEQAWSMIEALRQRVQAAIRGPADFYLFFLNPFKVGSVPLGFEARLEREICWMFFKRSMAQPQKRP